MGTLLETHLNAAAGDALHRERSLKTVVISRATLKNVAKCLKSAMAFGNELRVCRKTAIISPKSRKTRDSFSFIFPLGDRKEEHERNQGGL